MTAVRDLMTPGAECAKETDSLVDAARRMRDLDVGALPICGSDDRLHGMITDRDIVVRCVAEGIDPSTVLVSELAEGTPIWVDAQASTDKAMALMAEHQVRRLPVIEDHRLVGMLSQADVARHADERKVGGVVESISQES